MVIPGYDHSMKTAISIPDDVFQAADDVAQQLRMSRSELYANAVAEYVAKHRAADVTARLDEVYGREPSGLAPRLRRAQARSVGKSDW